MYINKYIHISYIDIYMRFNNTMAENCQDQTTYLAWFKKCQKYIVDSVHDIKPRLSHTYIMI